MSSMSEKQSHRLHFLHKAKEAAELAMTQAQVALAEAEAELGEAEAEPQQAEPQQDRNVLNTQKSESVI